MVEKRFKSVLGVTGLPLSGKNAVARILKSEGYRVIDMGEVVRKEVKERGLEPGKDSAKFVKEMREEKGMGAIAKLTVPYLEEFEGKKLLITGMRSIDEKEVFEEELDQGINVLAVWASEKVRRKRRERRGRREDLEGQKFHERDLREIGNGVAKLMALSDKMLVNEEVSLEELRKRVFDRAGDII